MLTGLILGDGTLVKKYANGGTYFQFAQGAVHLAYIQFIFELFKLAGLCNMKKLGQGKSHLKSTEKDYVYYYFTTKSLTALNKFESLFYQPKTNVNSKRVKVIPNVIGSLLTPVALAFWFMDDGNALGKGFQMNTNAFSSIFFFSENIEGVRR